MKISFSDIVALVSAGISVLALFIGLYAAFVAQKVATSDFQAVEQVKLDTAKLIAVLRSLMVKGVVYTQQDKARRDSRDFESFVDISPERKAIEEFMHSSTALAYYSFVAKKSKVARNEGHNREDWRVFFLLLGELLQTANPWAAAMGAAKLERQFDRIGEPELREISQYLNDLPRAIALLFSERENDVITYVLVERDEGPISEADFMDFVKFLREEKSVQDYDLDTFWAAFTGDVELLERAHEGGADLQIRSGTLIDRYKEFVPEFKRFRTDSAAARIDSHSRSAPRA
jgi:hypothetical protein